MCGVVLVTVTFSNSFDFLCIRVLKGCNISSFY